jgi:hypothetical protein
VTTLLQIRLALHAGMWFSSMQRASKKLDASPIHIYVMQELKKNLIKEMVALLFFVCIVIYLIGIDILDPAVFSDTVWCHLISYVSVNKQNSKI